MATLAGRLLSSDAVRRVRQFALSLSRACNRARHQICAAKERANRGERGQPPRWTNARRCRAIGPRRRRRRADAIVPPRAATSAGYTVSDAGDGRAALALAQRSLPDVVLLDVKIRDFHGLEVCRRLRARHGFAVAIIFFSGFRTEPYDRIAGLEAGGDDYIVKPFDPGELLARIGAHVRRLEATRQTRARPDSPLTPRQEESSPCSRAARASRRSLPNSSSALQRSGSTSSVSTSVSALEAARNRWRGPTKRASPSGRLLPD